MNDINLYKYNKYKNKYLKLKILKGGEEKEIKFHVIKNDDNIYKLKKLYEGPDIFKINFFIKIVQGKKIHIIYDQHLIFMINIDFFMKLVLLDGFTNINLDENIDINDIIDYFTQNEGLTKKKNYKIKNYNITLDNPKDNPYDNPNDNPYDNPNDNPNEQLIHFYKNETNIIKKLYNNQIKLYTTKLINIQNNLKILNHIKCYKFIDDYINHVFKDMKNNLLNEFKDELLNEFNDNLINNNDEELIQYLTDEINELLIQDINNDNELMQYLTNEINKIDDLLDQYLLIYKILNDKTYEKFLNDIIYSNIFKNKNKNKINNFILNYIKKNKIENKIKNYFENNNKDLYYKYYENDKTYKYDKKYELKNTIHDYLKYDIEDLSLYDSKYNLRYSLIGINIKIKEEIDIKKIKDEIITKIKKDIINDKKENIQVDINHLNRNFKFFNNLKIMEKKYKNDINYKIKNKIDIENKIENYTDIINKYKNDINYKIKNDIDIIDIDIINNIYNDDNKKKVIFDLKNNQIRNINIIKNELKDIFNEIKNDIKDDIKKNIENEEITYMK